MKKLLLLLPLLLVFAGCPVADGAPKCGRPNRPPCPPTTTTPPTTTQPTTTTPPPANTARIAVFLVNFPGDPRQPWTTQYIDSLFDRLADFYTESSFGQLTITADVFDYVTISYTGCNLLSLIGEQAEAAAGNPDLSGYTHRAYIWPSRAGCTFAGVGGGGQMWFNLSASCQGECAASFHLFPHEFGHNLGFDHSGTLDCGAVLLSDNCVFSELQDQLDVMGCCSDSRLSNIHRLQAGWIPPSQVVTIAQTTTITLEPLDDPNSKVYRVADGTGKYLYFEQRLIFSGGQFSSLLIRRAGDYTNPGMTELLDRTTLPVGSSFTLPHAPVTITNVSDDGTTAIVEVTFG